MGKPARARRDKERRVAGRHHEDREELVRRTLGRRALRGERWDGELTVQLLPQHLAAGANRQRPQRAATSPASAASGTSSTRRRSATYIASSLTSSGSGTASSRTGGPGRRAVRR